MDELERAILCGVDPNETNESKALAARMCEQFINTQEPWKYSLQKIFTTENIPVKFFCLNTCQIFFQQRYSALNDQDKQVIREALLKYYSVYIIEHPEETNAIKGKYAQVLVTFFRNEYPTLWPSFFTDLMSHLIKGPLVIETFLMILDTIDELVVRELDRSTTTDQCRAKNTAIKDYMREDCVVKLAGMWYDILVHFHNHNRICKLVLQNISEYVGWIDITLIVNDKFLSLIFKLLSIDGLKGGACKCLEKIVEKGMDFTSKLDLLNRLQLHNIIPQLRLDSDLDFQERLAKLVNAVGLESISCRSEAHKSRASAEVISSAENLVQSSLSIALQFLSNEYDDVSQSTLDFVHAYLYKLRHIQQFGDQQLVLLSSLLQILTQKLKYDDSYNFDREDDEEIEFQNFRKLLEKSIKSIIRLLPNLGYSFVRSLISSVIVEGDSSKKPMKDVEVALRVFYISMEAIADQKANETFFTEIINTILASKVLAHEHPTVSLLLLELIFRYISYITDNEQFTTLILMFFLGDKGIRHPLARVRSRACYLFVKSISSSKQRYLKFTKQMIESLAPLLKKNINERAQPLLDDDQNHLFELTGVLAFSVSSDTALHKSIIDIMVRDLFQVISTILRDELYKHDTVDNPQYGCYLSRCVSSISYFSKGFKNCTNEVFPYFQNALDFVLEAWGKVPLVDLRLKVMFFLHRMVECLDKRILPSLTRILETIINTSTITEMLSVIRLVSQLIARFSNEIGPIVEKLFIPFVTRIFNMIEKADDLSEKKELLKQYLLFLQYIVTHKLLYTLTIDENKPHTLTVLNTITQLCRSELDANIKNVKLCLIILNDISGEWLGKLAGYDQYFISTIIPLLFYVISYPKFKINDAEMYQTACYICTMQSKYSKALGAAFIEPTTQIVINLFGNDVAANYINRLTSSDDKAFTNFVLEILKLRK